MKNIIGVRVLNHVYMIRLTPESYLESMRKVIALLPDKQGQKIWDAGCGTGLLLLFLENAVRQGMIYYGSDLLSAGLSQARIRARELRSPIGLFVFKVILL